MKCLRGQNDEEEQQVHLHPGNTDHGPRNRDQVLRLPGDKAAVGYNSSCKNKESGVFNPLEK